MSVCGAWNGWCNLACHRIAGHSGNHEGYTHRGDLVTWPSIPRLPRTRIRNNTREDDDR